MTPMPSPAQLAAGIPVAAAATSVPVATVQRGEVWSFAAAGRWKDWFIPCGPAGYSNFLADVLDIAPRAAGRNWFCLIGMVAEHPHETFPIGHGCTHEFRTSGTLVVFANDLASAYGNNTGAITLRASLGGLSQSEGPVPEGLCAAWRLLLATLQRTWGALVAAALVFGTCAILALLPQGRDLLRSVGEDSGDRPGQQAIFAAALLFLAVQGWIWPRMIVNANYGVDRARWHPRAVLEWGPRVIGVSPILIVASALWANPARNTLFIVLLLVLAALFLVGVIYRRDVVTRLRTRAGRSPPGPAPLGRWWVILGLVLALASMTAATLEPVWFGSALGAPGVVFVGVGLIIPPLLIGVELGRNCRLPVIPLLLAWAVLVSWWMDNHAVGRRVLAAQPERPAVTDADRLSLDDAYKAWKAVQPTPSGGRLTMVLVASEGGASRAGYWTAEVLSALNEQSQGRLADSLFAINSVSGGSVGAVGYAAMLQEDSEIAPAVLRERLEGFVGRDALSPVLAGMLFPDLLQRFIPVAVLPDRAQALELAWETAWSSQCAAPACPLQFDAPFLKLDPRHGHRWGPIAIVQGASEETGRRILTTKLKFTPDQMDADDFFAITGHDVPISTAIHNGARFPYISPAGTLIGTTHTSGHILDGGYFDAAGVETIRELARAIADGPGKDDKLHFVFVFIGYSEATVQSRPEVVEDNRPKTAADPPAEQKQTRGILNELRAPLTGLLQSKSAHGAHLMRELKVFGGPVPEDVDPFHPVSSEAFDYVPIYLCNASDGYAPPMDWALSIKAKMEIKAATGFGSDPGRAPNPCGAANRKAIETVADQIGSAPAPPALPAP